MQISWLQNPDLSSDVDFNGTISILPTLIQTFSQIKDKHYRITEYHCFYPGKRPDSVSLSPAQLTAVIEVFIRSWFLEGGVPLSCVKINVSFSKKKNQDADKIYLDSESCW